MNKAGIVEVASFQLLDGVSETQLQAASQHMEDGFLSHCQGYQGRLLMRKDDRNWMDVVFWQNRESAEEATKNFHDSEPCAAYLACMDLDEVVEVLPRFEIMHTYGNVN